MVEYESRIALSKIIYEVSIQEAERLQVNKLELVSVINDVRSRILQDAFDYSILMRYETEQKANQESLKEYTGTKEELEADMKEMGYL